MSGTPDTQDVDSHYLGRILPAWPRRAALASSIDGSGSPTQNTQDAASGLNSFAHHPSLLWPQSITQHAEGEDPELLPTHYGGELVKESGDCVVCLEPFLPSQRIRVFPCHHCLHAHCALRWLNIASEPTCPTCRTLIPPTHRRYAEVPALHVEAEASEGTEDLAELPSIRQLVTDLKQACKCCSVLAVACVREVVDADAKLALTGDRLGDSIFAQLCENIRNKNLENGKLLLAALRSNDIPAAELAISRGADMDVRELPGHPGYSKTALMLAVQKRFLSIVDSICAAIAEDSAGPSANVNACDDEGYTALSWSAVKGYPEMFSSLLSKGADPSIRNHRGQSLLDLATSSRIKRILSETSSVAQSSRRRVSVCPDASLGPMSMRRQPRSPEIL